MFSDIDPAQQGDSQLRHHFARIVGCNVPNGSTQGGITERRTHGGDKHTHTLPRDVTGVIRTKNTLKTDHEESYGLSFLLLFCYILPVIC